MKMKEFSVIRYGPLPNTGRVSLHNFDLFFGKNEDGKTLTIDALVKLLLGRNTTYFENIDRVEENPEGYVIVEDDEGKETKLPEKGNLTEMIGLTPSECRNIFVIRNSDLSIADESRFYTNVTDRLTGLRTEEISVIKEILRELSKITPSGAFRDIKGEKLKTRIENAIGLAEKVKNLEKEVRKEKFDELEEKSATCSEKTDAIMRKIENLENARRREKYEKGKEGLDKLKETSKKFEGFEIYNEEDQQLWRDCEKDVRTYNERKEALLKDLGQNEKEFKKTSKELREKAKSFRLLDERKKKLDNEVKPELKNYEIKSGELALQEGKSRFFTSMGIISAILLGVSLIGAIVRTSILFYILVVVFLISTVVSWILRFQFIKSKAWLAGVFKRIKLTLSRFELKGESIEEILSNIQKFDEKHSKSVEEIQFIKRRAENLEDKIRELSKRTIPDIENKIEKAKEKIEDIRRKSREESLQEYTKKFKLKLKYEESLRQQRSILKNLFGVKGKTLEENISYWDEAVKELEEYKNKAEGAEYEEKTVSKLKEGEKLCRKKLDELQEKMSHFQKRLEETEREGNKILQLEADYLHCKTSVDLDAVRDKLQEFIDRNERSKDTALEAIKIFEEIENEEKEKVSELFGKDSSISKHFNGITDGLYEEVTFNQEVGKIKVRRKDGTILEAEKLSGGAYDQLYLSIRLALGEKLLKGKKGFFIMDDPFVKADPDRLQRQIQTLRKISELGWQVIYFSAKGEVRDALQGDIEEGTINHVEIQSIFS